jgi:hypothetical protein
MNDLQQSILELVSLDKTGLTWKELQISLNREYKIKAHHGSISGALNSLHTSGHVFSINIKRENCKPYCHKYFRNNYKPSERNDAPSVTKWRQVSDDLYTAMLTSTPHSPLWKSAMGSYEKMIND